MWPVEFSLTLPSSVAFCYTEKQFHTMNYYDYNKIQYFSLKLFDFKQFFKDTVEFTCALEFKISSQLHLHPRLQWEY